MRCSWPRSQPLLGPACFDASLHRQLGQQEAIQVHVLLCWGHNMKAGQLLKTVNKWVGDHLLENDPRWYFKASKFICIPYDTKRQTEQSNSTSNLGEEMNMYQFQYKHGLCNVLVEINFSEGSLSEDPRNCLEKILVIPWGVGGAFREGKGLQGSDRMASGPTKDLIFGSGPELQRGGNRRFGWG